MKVKPAILLIGALLLACGTQALAVLTEPETAPTSQQWTRSARSKTIGVTTVVQGVAFFDTVDHSLDQAKVAQKPAFVFMKKQSCRHCAKFESEMLKPSSKFLNHAFVCCRILSGSPDAKQLENVFGCHAYPHFLIFRPNGSRVHRWYGQPENSFKFIEDAHKGLELAIENQINPDE